MFFSMITAISVVVDDQLYDFIRNTWLPPKICPLHLFERVSQNGKKDIVREWQHQTLWNPCCFVFSQIFFHGVSYFGSLFMIVFSFCCLFIAYHLLQKKKFLFSFSLSSCCFQVTHCSNKPWSSLYLVRPHLLHPELSSRDSIMRFCWRRIAEQHWQLWRFSSEVTTEHFTNCWGFSDL